MFPDSNDQNQYSLTLNWRLSYAIGALVCLYFSATYIQEVIFYFEGKPHTLWKNPPVMIPFLLIWATGLLYDIFFARLTVHPDGIEIRTFLSKRVYSWETLQEPFVIRGAFFSRKWMGTPIHLFQSDWRQNSLGDLLRCHRPDFFTEDSSPE